MSTLNLHLPVPTPRRGEIAYGEPVDVSLMAADKVVTLTGNLLGVVKLEVELGGDLWTCIETFAGNAVRKIRCVARRMRVAVLGYTAGSASFGVAAALSPAPPVFVELPVPAGNASGAPVDVRELGPDWTAQVAGSFGGALVIEISADGTTFTQGFPTLTRGGLKNVRLSAAWARVTRTGAVRAAGGEPRVMVGAEGGPRWLT